MLDRISAGPVDMRRRCRSAAPVQRTATQAIGGSDDGDRWQCQCSETPPQYSGRCKLLCDVFERHVHLVLLPEDGRTGIYASLVLVHEIDGANALITIA